MKTKVFMHIALWLCIVTSMPQTAEGFKKEIPDMDYNRAWKNYASSKTDALPAKEYPFEACFKKAAKTYDIPLSLVMAFARGESDFNPKAKSAANCHGIMQIKWPGTAKDLGFTQLNDLYNPCKNIMAGARYIRMMIDRYDGNIHLAVAAYNYGPGRIKKTSEPNPAIPEGANWYSGYIYHHLQAILGGSSLPRHSGKKREKYKPGNKVPINMFHNPARAEKFMAYFRKKSPGLEIDWFRTSFGETHVVLVFRSEKQLKNDVSLLNRLGFYPDIKRRFR
ncbi:lytic transglycosylase domain-containing protein [uncultured Desulfobacter sp.]|uniref:lytic transglycosylase domain-containing protein n=1 Tax=uncultured Desulfobacter sp. TaxID=240139 RepID=UPI002AA82B0C|nr:lytic transglycosylase domain-containing protein [uncultured Desulfobacter sp.]